jgi:hypothetical protein
MTENLMTKNLMNEDLLTKIQREMNERLRELRGAVDEHDRLAVDLEALEAAPGPPVDPEARVDQEPAEPLANVVRLPVRRTPPRTRMVSPKVARLMHAPRRPALERSGVERVGATRLGSSRDEPAGEIDAEAEVYERAV